MNPSFLSHYLHLELPLEPPSQREIANSYDYLISLFHLILNCLIIINIKSVKHSDCCVLGVTNNFIVVSFAYTMDYILMSRTYLIE
jgi:hypothetical protein